MDQTDETSPERDVFDAELEILKLGGRFRWLVDEIDELKSRIRSLSARISRLKSSLEEDDEEEYREPIEPQMSFDLSKVPPGFQLIKRDAE